MGTALTSEPFTDGDRRSGSPHAAHGRSHRRPRHGARGWLVRAIATVAAVSVVLLALTVPTSSSSTLHRHHHPVVLPGNSALVRDALLVRPAPTPATTSPTTTTPPTTPSAPVATPSASTSDLTPQELGAEALTLVRYPWQQIPGYSIEFLPIADAPVAGFKGNTTFRWGSPGGTSVLYVYPGETVDELAGITAFEIGHEVDAAGLEPDGGHLAVENLLGIHPASWVPDCDCAEQGYLSGWYAAAFSDQWSPGVGNWSALAPMPTGATLAALQPWLDPAIS